MFFQNFFPKLHVFDLNNHALCVNDDHVDVCTVSVIFKCDKIYFIFEKHNQKNFDCFLNYRQRHCLKAHICSKILPNFSDKTLKRYFRNQKFREFLIATNFT